MSKIIAFVNQKGGVAKTTTAINLSACLAQQGKRVLLVDADPQGNATSGIGQNRREIEHCIYDVLIHGVPAQAVIRPSAWPNLSVLPATIQLAGAEIELVSAISREMVAPAETRISPVSGLTTSSDAMPPAMRAASASFLLNL